VDLFHSNSSIDSPLPPERMPNGVPAPSTTGRPNSWAGANWPNGPAASALAGLGKPPPGRDPKSRARSRDYLKQCVDHFALSSHSILIHLTRCLQEVSYLTSPQAMNPLPNRPLLNNPSIPLTLPNVPQFEQIAYNGRPRKVMPEAGKDFPLLNGVSMLPSPSSAPATSGGQIPPLERNNPMNSVILPQQPPTGQLGQMQQQQTFGPSQNQIPTDKDKDGETEPRQLTAIFRPDDAGEWKERLRLSHEAAEQARLERAGSGLLASGGSSWDRRDEDDVKDEEPDVDEEDAVAMGDGDGSKIWRAKRTLRKSVDDST